MNRLARCTSPKAIRTLNGWLTFVWVLLIPPSIMWWSQSVPYLVMVSVYANVAGHFAAWVAGRTEVRQEEQSS